MCLLKNIPQSKLQLINFDKFAEFSNDQIKIMISFLQRITEDHDYHSHNKRKDSLETRALLLIFSLELEISGVAVQRIHRNSEKW